MEFERETVMKKVRQWVVLFATLLVLTVNTLANLLPINGMTTGQISDQFDVFFIPAGYVFSIWGLIYILLIGYTVYQFFPANRADEQLNQTGWWYAAGCLANAAWLLAWHYQLFTLSFVFMGTLFVTLYVIYQKLDIGLKPAEIKIRLFVQIPFSIYLAWISVALISNLAVVLVFSGWNGFGIPEASWAVIMMVVAILLAMMTAFNRGDVFFLGVIIWALVGIAVKNWGTTPVYEAAVASAILVLIIAIVSQIIKSSHKPV